MDARDIIRRPIITEASMAQTERKRYVFEVDVRATKPQIKKAIEEIFDVQYQCRITSRFHLFRKY